MLQPKAYMDQNGLVSNPLLYAKPIIGNDMDCWGELQKGSAQMELNLSQSPPTGVTMVNQCAIV